MNNPSLPKLCSRCQILPRKIEGAGSLYLWFPMGHSLSKVIRHCQTQLDYQLNEEGQCLVIQLEENEVESFVGTLADILTKNELKNTKALFINHAGEPQLRDFSRTTSLSSLVSQSQSGWLLDMLAAERVTSQFQPIVYAQNTECIFAQEALLRGIAIDGKLIAPGRFFPLAAEADILAQLDRLARYSAIREAKRHQIQDKIFINFTPTSIYDPASCLRSTLKLIDEVGISHEQIVFEVVESAQVEDSAHLDSILKVYREAGFGVALDDFGAGFSNLNLLHQLRPDLIKLDMNLIRNVHADPYKALLTEKILEVAARLNIKTVAEGIETEQELNWVKEYGATFAQGYLIAKPSTIPITNLPNSTDRAIAS